MSIFKAYETSKTLEENGAELVLVEAENEDGTFPTLMVATAGTAYLKAFDRLKQAHRKEFQNQTLPDEKLVELSAKAAVDKLVRGWKNFRGRDGEPLTFSPQVAVALLCELPVILNRVTDFAADYRNYRAANLETEAKNS